MLRALQEPVVLLVMAKARKHIRMSPAEVAVFLAGRHKMQLATINPDGAPHLVTMYYAVFDGLLGFWTYRTSQKARNLERDARATCLVEAGEAYDELRGVQIQGTVERIEDTDRVRFVGMTVYGRYDDVTPAMAAYLEPQASKRWAYLVHPAKIATWDHRKLADVGDR
jgi:PPOX class probable F420-dependent enzyme